MCWLGYMMSWLSAVPASIVDKPPRMNVSENDKAAELLFSHIRALLYMRYLHGACTLLSKYCSQACK